MITSRIGRTLQEIGYITLLWNRIEDCWYLIFTCLNKELQRDQIDKVYRTADTGNKQRSLVLATAKRIFPAKSPVILTLTKLQERTNETARMRNSLMHADFHVAIDSGIADLGVSKGGIRGKENALAFKPLAEELFNLLQTLKQLDKDLDSCRIKLSGVTWLPNSLTLPELIDEYLKLEAVSYGESSNDIA